MIRQDDRRRYARKIGHGLVLLIDGRAHPVVDISTAGISFQASGHRLGSAITARLARLSKLDDCVDAKITVKGIGEATTHGEFRPTMALLRYIIGHIGEATGTQPAYFRS
jgi:hypothetical protein